MCSPLWWMARSCTYIVQAPDFSFQSILIVYSLYPCNYFAEKKIRKIVKFYFRFLFSSFHLNWNAHSLHLAFDFSEEARRKAQFIRVALFLVAPTAMPPSKDRRLLHLCSITIFHLMKMWKHNTGCGQIINGVFKFAGKGSRVHASQRGTSYHTLTLCLTLAHQIQIFFFYSSLRSYLFSFIHRDFSSQVFFSSKFKNKNENTF